MNDDRQPIQIVGAITAIETIAEGSGIRELSILRAYHGGGRWKKKKGIATVQQPDGSTRLAEIHWYEAHGIGKVKLKIKAMVINMQTNQFVVCVNTADFGDFSGEDLLLGKCYEVLATEDGWLRIVDESGEAYLYPADWFVPIVLSQEAAARLKQSLAAAA